MNTYIALLRGVNVGGKNSLPMKELVSIMEQLGAQNVRTYIQSGNTIKNQINANANANACFQLIFVPPNNFAASLIKHPSKAIPKNIGKNDMIVPIESLSFSQITAQFMGIHLPPIKQQIRTIHDCRLSAEFGLTNYF